MDWKCNPWQGEKGKHIHQRITNNLDMCKQRCLEFEGCIAIDYRKSGNSCRMYGHNTPRKYPGPDPRTYCTTQKEGKQKFEL